MKLKKLSQYVGFGLSVAGLGLSMSTPTLAKSEKKSKSAAIEEVVVTANTKFGSELQTAPVSATALDASFLQRSHLENVQEVQSRTPSLVFSNPTNFAQAYIRGIGSNFSLAGLESAVAFYEDGVYLQRQAGATLDVVDLSGVQVLKGPQGTLYGRNATGGAILIETADPVDRFEGNVSVEVGRFGHRRLQGVLNVPVSDTVAARFAAQKLDEDGYINDTVNGGKLGKVHSHLLRGKIRWQPNDQLSAIYTVEYSQRASNLYAQHQRLNAPLCLACAIYGITPAQGFYDATQSYDPPSQVNYLANSLRLFYENDTFNVTSVTSYRNTTTKEFNEQDGTAAQFLDATVTENGPTFTEDTYLRTTLSGAMNYLVGLSYERDRDALKALLFGDALAPLYRIHTDNDVSLNSWSAYAEAYWDITPDIKLTAGGRYNVDDKQIDVTNDLNASLAYGNSSFKKSATFRDFTPRVVLSYSSDYGYYYVSYNRGVKSGGFSTPAFTPPVTLKSEKLNNFEIGAKNQLLDGRLTTAVALFYGLYSDVQVQRVDARAGGVVAENAAKSKLYGAEADVAYAVTDDFKISVGGTYLHNKFENYDSAAVFEPATSGVGLQNGVMDLSGKTMPRSPKFSAYVSLDYSREVSQGWTIDTLWTARYTDSYDFLAGAGGPLGLDRQKSFTKVDASVSLTTPSGMTQFSVYANNLTNRKYFDYAATSAFGAFYTPAAPSVYGMRVTQKFD